MIRHFKLLRAFPNSRSAVTVAAAKLPRTSPAIATSEEGFQLASVTVPGSCSGLARIAIVFNAGSRHELDSSDHGITHLIRRAFGLSTAAHTAINLTRHMQQMGARVTCTTTREHMIYTVEVAPNLISRAGSLLADMATGTAFYEWELKSIANKLVQKDVDLLNRRNLPALSSELLHEAAFGQHPSGSGLGVSLFSPADRVGSYSLEQIEQFHQHYFVPVNCSLAFVSPESDVNGLDLLHEIKGDLKVRAPLKVPEKVGKVHGFVGGDVRRDLAAASHVYANIAWPTLGKGSPQQLAFDLAACLLTGSMGRFSWAGRAFCRFGGDPDLDGVHITGFHRAYDNHGLFGVRVVGPSAKVVAERMPHVVQAIRSVKFTPDELTKGKAMLKANILMGLESPMDVAIDLAAQLAGPGHTYQAPESRAAAVDGVSLSQVNDAISQSTGSPRAALSAVGAGASEILPVNLLLSA